MKLIEQYWKCSSIILEMFQYWPIPGCSSIWSLKYTIFSAVVDCRKYRLSEYSRNDTTCRLLIMAMLIHKRHVKSTASLYWQDVIRMLNGIRALNVPATRWEVRF